MVNAGDDLDFLGDSDFRLVTRRFVEGEVFLDVRTLSGEVTRSINLNRFRIVDFDSAAERFVAVGYLPAGYGLFVSDGAGLLREISDASPLSGATINGRGDRVAVTSSDRNTIRIVSFDDLRVERELPCPSMTACNWMGWDLEDDNVLWLAGSRQDRLVKLELNSGVTRAVARGSFPSIKYGLDSALLNAGYCANTGDYLEIDNSGIALIGGQGGTETQLVEIADYRNDIVPAISFAAFVAKCQHVLFGFSGRSWLVDVSSREIGPLDLNIVSILQ